MAVECNQIMVKAPKSYAPGNYIIIQTLRVVNAFRGLSICHYNNVIIGVFGFGCPVL